MKKVLAILFTLAFVFTASSALATPAGYSYAYSGTDRVVGAEYDAYGWFFSAGSAEATADPALTGSFAGRNVAGAYSAQGIESNAEAFGLFGPTRTVAYGDAYQYSTAGVDLGNGTRAWGYQESSAGYFTADEGWFYSSSEGSALTTGWTVAGAARWDTPNTSTSVAGAATGSSGFATTGSNGCYEGPKGNNGVGNGIDGPPPGNDGFNDTEGYGPGNPGAKNGERPGPGGPGQNNGCCGDGWSATGTSGYGFVSHSTFANKGDAMAGTSGAASYGYQTNGYNYSSGCGMAATGGISNVVRGPNGGVTATARSVSFSTNGPTHTSGVAHIGNMPR